MDSPDILQNPASAIGQQFLANGGAPQADSDASTVPGAPTPTPQTGLSPAAPAQAPATPAPDPVAAKHQSIGKLFTSMLSGGSGSSASNFWRSLIGGALVGMGAAEDAPVVAHGPYGDVRSTSIGGAASRGFTAGMGLQEQQQGRQRKQQQQDAEEKRKAQESKIQLDDAMLRKASDARAQQASIQASVEHEKRMTMLDQSIKSGNWEQAQRTAQAAQQQVNFFNALQDVGAQALTGSDDQPLQYSTHEEAEKAAHDNPSFFIGNFKTRTAYDPNTGKYGIYRVPDTDIKNVQLKDQQGNIHTIPRMSPSDYLDYQTRVQNLQKGKLEIAKVGAEITRLQNDVKASGLYGSALKDLTAATEKDGNVDLAKLPAGSRAVLVEHAAKGLEDALRARSAAIEKHTKAVDAGDQAAIDDANQSIEDATQISRHYGGVLTTVTGNKKAGAPAPSEQVAPGAAPPKGQQMSRVETAPFTRAVGRGVYITQIPGQTGDQTAKIYQDLNALESPKERQDYIAKLPIADADKQKLKTAALRSEAKPTESTTKIIAPDGSVRAIPKSQVDAALAAGGTLAE